MDKEQTVKDMLKYSGYCNEYNCKDCIGCREREFAKDLAENGYGNINQTVISLLQRIESSYTLFDISLPAIQMWCKEIAEEYGIKEYYE